MMMWTLIVIIVVGIVRSFTLFSYRKIRCNQCWFVRYVKTSN